MNTNILRFDIISTTSVICASSVSSLNHSSQVKAFPAMKHAKRSSLPINPTLPIKNSYEKNKLSCPLVIAK